MMRAAGLVALAGLAVAVAAGPERAHAVVIYAGEFTGNDCSGGPFAQCRATTTGTVQGGTVGSPTIFKIEAGGQTDTGGFATIDGSEFDLDFDNTTKVLEWTYTPGTGDPEIHFFTIKQSNHYHLFYDLTAPILSFSIDLDNNSFGIDENGFSHVTWFDTVGPPTNIPEPGTLGLLGLSLAALGLGAARRRRRQS